MLKEKRSAAYRLSTLVAVALAVLTGIEYVVGLYEGFTVILFLLALLKAVVVVYYFMHVTRLWQPEEH